MTDEKTHKSELEYTFEVWKFDVEEELKKEVRPKWLFKGGLLRGDGVIRLIPNIGLQFKKGRMAFAVSWLTAYAWVGRVSKGEVLKEAVRQYKNNNKWTN